MRLAAAFRPGARPIDGRNGGFSLIELSVVLVLLTIVLGLGLGALNAQFQSANTSVTKKRMDLIREALIAHLGATRRLPCADNPSVGGVTGIEDCPATFGVVPYATLGLSRESAEDGWGNLFSYAVFTGPAPTCPGTGIDWKSATCFGEGKSGGLTVNDGTIGAATPVTTGAIAVLISHGANGLGAWTREGTRNASPVGCEEAQNASLATSGCSLVANTFYQGERQGVDDVVTYVSASEALQQLAHQGILKTAPGRLGEDLQTAVDTVLGAFATAGCTVIPAAPSGIDPWGNAYSSVVSMAGSTIYQISSNGCAACTPAVPATARTLTKTELNAYLLKAGLPTCP